MPTLLLCGDSDRMVPAKYGEAFQRLLPNARMKLISQCGYFPQDERSAEFLDALLSFFQGR